jgi:Bacterial protein of unknown function (DUF839)
VQNPLASNPTAANVRWLTSFPGVSHEGLRFDRAGNLYFIDESNTGSIYRFIPKVRGDLTVGQVQVLKVNAYAGNATQDWNSASNINSTRTGVATWLNITDANGVKLTTANPFQWVNVTGGREAADELGATPYGRPEDLTINNFTGTDILYVPATSEIVVYSVILSNPPVVKVFCSRSTIDLATGLPVGSTFADPDNVAVDSNGHVYVVEDQPHGVADIWQAVDASGDGVAESMARWLALGVTGSEPTGLIFDPNNNRRAILNIQHPDSGNDALWEITYPSTPVSPPAQPPVPPPITAGAPVGLVTGGCPRLNATTALNASKAALPIGGIEENTVPFNVAPNVAYRKIIDRRTLNATGSFPFGFGDWDMVAWAAPEGAAPGAYPAASEYIFMPIEESVGGGVFRYNVRNNTFALLAVGKGDGIRNGNPYTFDPLNDDYSRIDPCTYTPFNTLLFAEETTGKVANACSVAGMHYLSLMALLCFRRTNLRNSKSLGR